MTSTFKTFGPIKSSKNRPLLVRSAKNRNKNVRNTNKITIRQEYVTTGFIRNCCNVYIPEPVVRIIRLFAHEPPAEWDTLCKGSALVVNGDAVKATGYDRDGSILMKCILKPPNKYEWTFVIESLAAYRSRNCLIGIYKVSAGAPSVGSYFTDTEDNGYAFVADRGYLTEPSAPKERGDKYGKWCHEGDVIIMHLDLHRCELSYSINDEYYGVAFDVDCTQYRAAVYLTSGSNEETSVRYLK